MKGYELRYTMPTRATVHVHVGKSPNMLIFMRHFRRVKRAATVLSVRCTDMMEAQP